MDPAACPRLAPHVGSCLHTFYEVFGDFSDSLDRPGSAGLGGHVGLATQYASLTCDRIADDQYRPQ
jgi:hypothetical protein